MHLFAKLLVPIALALTVVPGLRTIAKAQHPEPMPSPLPLTLPRCAQAPQKKLLHSLGCGQNDPDCMCAKKQWLPYLLGSVKHLCDKSDQETVKQFGAAYCGFNPKTITPSSPSPTMKPIPRPPKNSYTCEKELTTVTVHSTVTKGTKTSTKMNGEATKTSHGTVRPTKGSKDGMIGSAGRVEIGLVAWTLVGFSVISLWFLEL